MPPAFPGFLLTLMEIMTSTTSLAGAALALFVAASAAPGPLGNRSAGERLFKERKCVVCHSVNGVGGKSAPPLGGQAYTPNAMASAMWSHATGMWQAMDRAGIQRPQLTGQQAADLYAFLAGRVATDKPGDPGRGSKVFQAKFCASCHDNPMMGAPKLGGRVSPFSMVASLWEHVLPFHSARYEFDLLFQALLEETENLDP